MHLLQGVAGRLRALTLVVPSTVKIRNWKLALLHHSLIVAAALIFFVVDMLYGLAYMRFYPVTGTSRISLHSPKINSKGDRTCDFTENDCMPDWSKPSTLHYDCGYHVHNEESNGHGRIYLPTFSREYRQDKILDEKYGVGFYWNTTGESDFAFMDVERFTLLIDHTMIQRELDEELDSSRFAERGKLWVTDTGPLQQQLCKDRGSKKAPCLLAADTHDTRLGREIFEVGTLLRAAGIDLNSKSSLDSSREIRMEGAALTIYILYSNTVPLWGRTDHTYTYVVHSSGTRIKETAFHLSADEQSRTFEKLYGLNIEVVQSGQLGKPNVAQVVLQIAGYFVVIKICRFTIVSFAKYCARHKKFYQHFLQTSTPDLTTDMLRTLEEMPLAELDQIAVPYGVDLEEQRTRKMIDLLKNGWSARTVIELERRRRNTIFA